MEPSRREVRDSSSHMPVSPTRPLEPARFQNIIKEPTYITTLPKHIESDNPNFSLRSSHITVTTPPSSFKLPLKGILKNGSNRDLLQSSAGNGAHSPTRKKIPYGRSISEPEFRKERKHLLSSETSDVAHFDLEIQEPVSVPLKGQNKSRSSEKTRNKRREKKKDTKSPKDRTVSKERNSVIESSLKYTHDSYKKATRAAKIESASGILHFLVIIMCIITITLMTKVSGEWEVQRRRCPLYVKNSPNVEIYWGNEKMAACRYGAYMPVVVLIISFSLIVLRGGILCSWRNGGDVSKILLSPSYAKIMFFIEFFELIINISIASVVTDGFRQTCVGFQLYPWPDDRPQNCKDGYYGRDDAYGTSHTYARILTSIMALWAATVFILLSAVLYLIRFCNMRKN